MKHLIVDMGQSEVSKLYKNSKIWFMKRRIERAGFNVAAEGDAAMSSVWGRRLVLTGIVGAFATSGAPRRAPAGTDQPLLFGVFPYLPALRLGRAFGPIAADLATATSRRVRLLTKSNFAAFRDLLLAGTYDIAFVHPFLFAEATAVLDYRPVARVTSDLRGVVLAPPSLSLADYQDLIGRTLAAPPELSAMAQLVRHELRVLDLLGDDDVRLVFKRTKVACIHAVVTGEAAACVLPDFIVDQMPEIKAVGLERRFRTAAVPGVILTAHGRIGPELEERIRARVVGWSNDPAGRDLLARAGWPGFAPTTTADYVALLPRHGSER